MTSYHRHDYNTHTDKNGFTYMVDGGTEYLRRSDCPGAPAEELSVYADAPFEVIRESYHWGASVNGERRWIPIGHLETSHVEAILDLQYVSPFMKEMLRKELKYRKDREPPAPPKPKRVPKAKKEPSKKTLKKVV